jgi:hypothetical protein
MAEMAQICQQPTEQVLVKMGTLQVVVVEQLPLPPTESQVLVVVVLEKLMAKLGQLVRACLVRLIPVAVVEGIGMAAHLQLVLIMVEVA